MMSFKIFLLVLMLICERGNSLKCYTCSTEKDPNSACTDLTKGKETVTTEECSGDEVCAIFTLTSPATGKHKITRACYPKDVCTTLHSKQAEYNKLEDCEVCDTDLCGSGTRFSVSVAIMFMSLLFRSLIN